MREATAIRVKGSPLTKLELQPNGGAGVGPAETIALELGKGYVLRTNADVVINMGASNPNSRDHLISRDTPFAFVADTNQARIAAASNTNPTLAWLFEEEHTK